MKKKTANSSIGGDSCVCLPQAHLPATFASRIRRAQPTNFKSTRQYRSHWERHLWMACCFASHAAAAATRSEHWLTDWAHTAALQYFRSFFVCRLSNTIIYRWRWRFKLMRSHIEFAPNEHMRKRYAHTLGTSVRMQSTSHPYNDVHTLTHSKHDEFTNSVVPKGRRTCV